METQPYLEFAMSKLAITFNNINLLITAFTHRSYLNEHRKTVNEHNERLEFLGDAVLELVVTEYLYLNYSESEGILTNWRSCLVRTESLAESASRLDFEHLLRLSKGEKRGSERARTQILANCFEAVIGAIYLDQGYEPTKRFITSSVISKLKHILASDSWMDAKSRLQEVSQKQNNVTPQYRVLKEEGPDHDKTFKVGVYVNDSLIGSGNGSSKQAAQQKAAQNALKKYAI
jgi:ribonuclease-3